MLNLEVSDSSSISHSNMPVKQNYYYNNDEYTSEFYNTKCYNKHSYFLLCKSCFWCCTLLYFNKSKKIIKCPCCNGIDNDIASMLIFSEKKKKKTYANNSFANQYDERLLLYNEDIDVNSEVKRGL